MRGHKLLQMCKTTNLRILNGRFFGDTMGRLTCYSHTGQPSTIDYVLASNSLMDNVQYIAVNDLTVHSIHCSITSCFSLDNSNNYHSRNTEIKYEPLRKFTWSQVDTHKFVESLASNHIQQQLNGLIGIFGKVNLNHTCPKETN